jgi:hypothetical protein
LRQLYQQHALYTKLGVREDVLHFDIAAVSDDDA